jgi:hypothetical protein
LHEIHSHAPGASGRDRFSVSGRGTLFGIAPLACRAEKR